jgi:tetratricopeptide (TPR) repeat protein
VKSHTLHKKFINTGLVLDIKRYSNMGLMLLRITLIAIFAGSFLLPMHFTRATPLYQGQPQVQQGPFPNNANATAGNDTGLDSLSQPQEVLDYYDSILAIDPNNVTATAGKGGALFYLGRYDEALASFDRALALDPNNANALDGKAAVFDSLGEHQEAVQYYDRALQIDPNNKDILNNKGSALGNLGRYDEALQYTERALQIDPNNKDILNNKGSALFYLGRYDEALASYDSALQTDPNDISALINMGTALALTGRYEEAIAHFDAAHHIDPHNVPALVNLGMALENLGRHQEASLYFEEASMIYQSSVSAAPVITSEKNLVLLVDTAQRDYYYSFKSAVLHSNLDLGSLELENLKQYIEPFELHYISHGYHVDVDEEIYVGISMFKSSDYQGAIVILDNILNLNAMHPGEIVQKPTLAATLFNKGLCLEKLGQQISAEQYKQQAHDVDPYYNGGFPPIAKFAPPALAALGIGP